MSAPIREPPADSNPQDPSGGERRTGTPVSFRAQTTARTLALTLTLMLALGATISCEERGHRDIQDEINILTRRNDALVPPATERLAGFGRLAIPQIETALHTAAPSGRLHLIEALERIGDPEAVPILRHFAVYDVKGDVRQACLEVLGRWSADAPAPSGASARSDKTRRRADRAREAEQTVARKRAAGEGPLVFEGGTPGVPTVGAPEPVGSDLEKTR